MNNAFAMAKIASVGGVIRELAETGGHVIGGTVKATKGAVRLAGDVGEGIARGAGSDKAHLGRYAGHAVLGAGALVGGVHAKNKADQWRYQHGFYGV